MSGLFTTLSEARASGDFSALVKAVPYAQFLGISVDTSQGDLIATLHFSEHLVGNSLIPALHGGTIGALLESTAIFKLLWQAEAAKVPKIINVTIEYLRTARTVDTRARAVITRQGRRIANVRVEAWQEDPARPIAAASTHFLLDGGG
ncbi:MAG: PaaI family thioesterase [Deltaproteobacteria bacterium]|nr:PaaI family thioesterase [Deltaproteobacteria bacterium]